MRLEAGEGKVVMKPYEVKKNLRIELPENMELDEFPTFEIVHIGVGKQSPYTGQREATTYAVGDRVIVAAGRCAMLTMEGEKHFVVDWSHILGKVTG